MWNKKFAYVLNHLKIFKAVPKNNLWTHSPRQNKKPCWQQLPISKSQLPEGCRDNIHASFTFVYQNKFLRYETEKMNTTIEFCIFKLV